MKILWIVGTCFLGRWSFEYGPMPCEPVDNFAVYGSSSDAMNDVRKRDGSVTVLEVLVTQETEFKTKRTSSTTIESVWPRKKK